MKKLLLILSCLSLAPLAHANLWQTYRGHLPIHAFSIGKDTDGKTLYACRARFNNSIQIGKTWENYNKCNIAYGGKEYLLNKYDIMVKQSWQKTHWGNKRDGHPLTLGRDTNGSRLFLCKTRFKGSVQPGKTWAGYNHCNISYAGKELIRDNYRVLLSGPNHNNNPQRTNQKAGYQCINSFGNKICGYNCLKAGTNAACAATPKQHCVADNFGHIQCGYNCVKTPFKVACSTRRNENCVANVFNEVRCGRNCQIDQFNRIHCG